MNCGTRRVVESDKDDVANGTSLCIGHWLGSALGINEVPSRTSRPLVVFLHGERLGHGDCTGNVSLQHSPLAGGPKTALFSAI